MEIVKVLQDDTDKVTFFLEYNGTVYKIVVFYTCWDHEWNLATGLQGGWYQVIYSHRNPDRVFEKLCNYLFGS